MTSPKLKSLLQQMEQGTTVQRPRQAAAPASKHPPEIVGWFGVPHGKLQINDLVFTVPPENIQIYQQLENIEVNLLRTSADTVVRSGHGEYHLQLTLVFPDQQSINEGLAPLLFQLEKTPFCLIENELVRHTVFPGTQNPETGSRQPTAPNMVFSLLRLALTTLEGNPGALQLQLHLLLFNYFPYSRRFTYRRNWGTANAARPADAKEGAALIQEWHSEALETFNPRGSEAWRAFWQHGWQPAKRLLHADLSADFSLRFTLFSTRSGEPRPYRAMWHAKQMVPVQVIATRTNRIARLPILNWPYATHQYMGGSNYSLQVVFICQDSARRELEFLQYLINSSQEQITTLRQLSRTLQPYIYNDIARLCGIEQVTIQSLTVDTLPGQPDALRVVLELGEYAPSIREELHYAETTHHLDGVLQQALNLLLDLAVEREVLSLQYKTITTFDPNIPGVPVTGDQRWVWDWGPRAYSVGNETLYLALYYPYGDAGENLLQLLQIRPNQEIERPILPGEFVGAHDRYYNNLRNLLRRLLDGPLAQMPQFRDLRVELYQRRGNIQELLCYPDLELPPHPATGRVADVDPDCYLFNESDARPVDLSRAFHHCLDAIVQSYNSVERTLHGTGGLGWDYEIVTQDTMRAVSRPAGAPSAAPAPGAGPRRFMPRDAAVAEALEEATRRTGIPRELLEAVIQQESGGNPDATSPKGARGLMQIMDATAGELAAKLGVSKEAVLNDPYWNVIAGATYLKEQYDRFGSWELALAAYNAGPGRVAAAGNAIPNIPETQNYVRRVMAAYQSSAGQRAPAVTPGYDYIMPVSGTVTSTFYDARDNGRLHAGIDIGAAAGTPIVAPTNLTVTLNKWSDSGGWTLWGRDEYGNIHQFHHLQAQSPLAVGQTVPQGAIVGYVGSTGASSGPHLDWKIQVADGTPGAVYNHTNGYYLDIGALFGLQKGQKTVAGTALRTGTQYARSGTAAVVAPAGLGDAFADSGMNTTERSFDGWIHHPRRPGRNYNVDSISLTSKNLAYLPTKDMSYLEGAYRQLQNQRLSPRNQHAQAVDAQAAQEIFREFANTEKENVLTMRRAYPTYALYFIDEMRAGAIVFTNAYSWSAVQEIRLIRSRKNPVDTLIVTLANTKGQLMTQQLNTLQPGQDVNTMVAFNRQIIKEGTVVKLKLGYANDPERLPLVFTGKITEIEGSNTALVTITCQSFAIELFQREIGDDPNSAMGWFNSDTREILSILLTMPEVAHFGRWAPNQLVQPGEGGLWHGSIWRYFFRFFPNPADNNIFTPSEDLLRNVWHYLNTSGYLSGYVPFRWLNYVPYRQTAWEIIAEMTLRHPGYIAAVVPYEGVGSHMATLFFGLPSQMYFWRAADIHETIAMQHYIKSEATYRRTHGELLRKRMRPFRRYFYVDSEHHLILNGLRTTARDTYNAVTVEFVEDAREAFSSFRQRRDEGGLPDPSAFITRDILNLKANDAIREDYCRWFHTRERNCEGSRWALCYATSYLFRLLKDCYEGEIVIVGEPEIKPYDIVMLFDTYNDIAGPIEVEQVVHILNAEQGFITVITPDLVVNTNEYLSASLIDGVMRYYTAMWLGLARKSPFNSGQGNSADIADIVWTGIPREGEVIAVSPDSQRWTRLFANGLAAGTIIPLAIGKVAAIPISIVVAGCGLMMFNWARKLQPIRITPVIWRGRPFVCGLDGFTLDTAWGRAVNGAIQQFRGFGHFLEHAMALIKQLVP